MCFSCVAACVHGEYHSSGCRRPSQNEALGKRNPSHKTFTQNLHTNPQLRSRRPVEASSSFLRGTAERSAPDDSARIRCNRSRLSALARRCIAYRVFETCFAAPLPHQSPWSGSICHTHKAGAGRASGVQARKASGTAAGCRPCRPINCLHRNLSRCRAPSLLCSLCALACARARAGATRSPALSLPLPLPPPPPALSLKEPGDGCACRGRRWATRRAKEGSPC